MTPAPFVIAESLGGLHLCKAVAAVHRTIVSGLEGHAGFAAAGSAGGCEKLTGTTGGVLAGITAGLAALGLVLEALLRIELLLAGGENEFIPALFAN